MINDIITDDAEYIVDWQVTRPIEAKDLHCDLCGKPADSIHFVPWVIDCKKVVFGRPNRSEIEAT